MIRIIYKYNSDHIPCYYCKIEVPCSPLDIYSSSSFPPITLAFLPFQHKPIYIPELCISWCQRSAPQDNRGRKKHAALYSQTLLSSWTLYSNQDVFKLSSLDVTHASLVNEFWLFGGNELSQRFIERCIKKFPSSCVLGPEGTPASWTLMDQTGEIRMGGTMPKYRTQGLVSFVVYSQEQLMRKRGFPIYSHTDKSNTIMQKMSHSLQHFRMPCAWNQWKCVPVWSWSCTQDGVGWAWGYNWMSDKE